MPPYWKHPAYIDALATIAREELSRFSWKPDKLVISFHGVPKSHIDRGDVYRLHAEGTTCLLAEALGLKPDDYELCFQSRFGREEWLKPYTDERLGELGRSGVKRIAAICPGFTTDCLETIDEIGREGKRQFLEAGGREFQLIPCLNTHPAWIKGMEKIAREELSGWLTGL